MKHSKHIHNKHEHSGHEHAQEHESKAHAKKSKHDGKIITGKLMAGFIVALVIGFFIGTQFSVFATTDSINGLITQEEASQKTIQYINTVLQGQAEVKLLNVTESNGLYEMQLDVGGMGYNSFITKDGKLLFPQAINLDEAAINKASVGSEEASASVPKSNRPDVKVFVYTYCPYGTQTEKGLLPVIDLLGSKADISLEMIGAMHGLHEELEAKRQLCLIKEQPATFTKYLKLFIESSEIGECQNKLYTEFNRDEAKMDECVAPIINSYFKSVGIDAEKVDECMANRAEGYYSDDMKTSADNGATGSPTLMINGVAVRSGRSPDAIKEAICSAFITAPEECSTTLSEVTPSPGFGSGTGSTSSGSC